MIPQYGADAGPAAEATDATATGVNPAAKATAAANTPILRNIFTDSPRNSYRAFAVR
ncbi:hypothetical protein [Actinophytocola sp.]|uniref:hypothetical protein n=1 Tax=Actinophytocola sp. TaxID=1872138 RepID=UPI003D6BDA0A